MVFLLYKVVLKNINIHLWSLSINSILIKTHYDVNNIDALIIPGGESTVLTTLIKDNDLLYKKLYNFILVQKKPVFGTCAGTILLSSKVKNKDRVEDGLFPIVDILTERNYRGSQVNSFNKNLNITGIKKNFNCIFIRPPLIKNYNNNIDVLAYYNKNPVFVKKDNVLLVTFHPELENTLIHKFFLNLLKKKN